MENQTIRTAGVLNATVRVDNSAHEGRKYDIAANVNLSDNEAVSVTDGTLTVPGGADTMQFSMRNSGFRTESYVEGDAAEAAVRRMEMMEAAEAFVAEAMKFRFEI